LKSVYGILAHFGMPQGSECRIIQLMNVGSCCGKDRTR